MRRPIYATAEASAARPCAHGSLKSVRALLFFVRTNWKSPAWRSRTAASQEAGARRRLLLAPGAVRVAEPVAGAFAARTRRLRAVDRRLRRRNDRRSAAAPLQEKPRASRAHVPERAVAVL